MLRTPGGIRTLLLHHSLHYFAAGSREPPLVLFASALRRWHPVSSHLHRLKLFSVLLEVIAPSTGRKSCPVLSGFRLTQTPLSSLDPSSTVRPIILGLNRQIDVKTLVASVRHHPVVSEFTQSPGLRVPRIPSDKGRFNFVETANRHESSKIRARFGQVRSLHVHDIFQRSETFHLFARYVILRKRVLVCWESKKSRRPSSRNKRVDP
jgi:hypothetical protein